MQLLQREGGKFLLRVTAGNTAVKEFRALKGRPQRRVVGNQILRAPQRMHRRIQTRLGCRAQNDTCAANTAEKVDRQIEQGQHRFRHRLHFIQHHNAVAECMHSPDTGGAPVEQGIQKLHQRSDDHRRIPVFHQQLAGVPFVGLLRLGRDHIGVVFENQSLILDPRPQNGGVLF